MPLISLSEALAVEDPAPSWTWTATIVLPASIQANNLNTGGSSGNSFSLIGPSIERVYVESVGLPFVNIEPRSRYRGGSHMNFAGPSNLGACQITFFETKNFKILRHMLSWQSFITSNKSNSPTAIGCYSLPVDYIGSITLEHFDGTGAKQLEVTMSCWPTGVMDWTLDYHTISNLTVIANFAVNNIDYKWTDNYSIVSPHNSYHGSTLPAFPSETPPTPAVNPTPVDPPIRPQDQPADVNPPGYSPP